MKFKHTKFKYKTIIVEGLIYDSNSEEGFELMQTLDKLGNVGWEIINVIPQKDNLVFLFKQATSPSPFE